MLEIWKKSFILKFCYGVLQQKKINGFKLTLVEVKNNYTVS